MSKAETEISSKWDVRFLELALTVSYWSKDPSTQVGCVLVDDKRRIIGVGYNGFPRGVCDCHERLNDRPTKYLFVQHAEANAVMQSTADMAGATAYVTHSPCASCSGILIQAGIARVVTVRPEGGLAERYKDSFAASDTMFSEAGVRVDYYEIEKPFVPQRTWHRVWPRVDWLLRKLGVK